METKTEPVLKLQYAKIVLVNPYPYYAYGINEATIYPPLGLAAIAAWLEQQGATCKIVDANIFHLRNDTVLKEIREFKPDLAGVQMNVVTAKAGIELCKLLKEQLRIPIAIGGPFTPDKIAKLLKDSSADFFVHGEGELTFAEICTGRPPAEIKGISYLADGKGVTNPLRPLIPDISTLPMPAYHLLPDFRNYRARARATPVAPIFTSRGCPYKCTFCSSSSLKSPFQNKIRFRSAENVVAEIEALVKTYGVKQIDVLDDNFTFDMDRAERILDLLIAKDFRVLINFQNGLRADRVDRNLVAKMAKAGVYKTGIGIESGSKKVLLSIKKGLDLRKVEEAIALFREYNIISIGFFMLGFPADTPETMQETIDFAVRANPSLANISLVLPLPGTVT